jgi:hypothetical protein
MGGTLAQEPRPDQTVDLLALALIFHIDSDETLKSGPELPA